MENWTVGDRDPVDLNFTGVPGLKNHVNIPNNPTCGDYFELFMPPEVYEIMSTETNRYAADYLAKMPKQYVRILGSKSGKTRHLQRIGEQPGRESSYQCGQCKKKLCVQPCFRLYHQYKDFELDYSNYKAANNDI